MSDSVASLFNQCPEAVLVTDARGQIVYANPIAEDLFALYGGKLCTHTLPDLYADDISSLYHQKRPDFQVAVSSGSFRTTYQRRDGLTFLGDTIANPTPDGCVFIVRVATPMETTLSALQILHQITAASATAADKIRAILQLGAAFFSMPIAIQSCIEGDDYTVEHCVDPEQKVTAGQRFSLAGTYCAHTVAAEKSVGFHHAGHSEIRTHPCYRNYQLEAYLGCPLVLDGAVYGTVNFSQKRAVRPFSGDDMVFLQLLTDQIAHILQRERSQQKLRTLALTDPLTGLANRRAVLETLGACQAPASVLLMDLDHFKQINDTWGHDGGDLVLKWFADLCVEVVGGAGTCGRFGGEEFLIVLPDASLGEAELVAQQLLAEMGDRQVTVGPDTQISASASIGAAHQRPGEGFEALIARADAAMYTAKQSGRARTCLAA